MDDHEGWGLDPEVFEITDAGDGYEIVCRLCDRVWTHDKAPLRLDMKALLLQHAKEHREA